jgi:poly(3-hydroxybutyrate) depolymerase
MTVCTHRVAAILALWVLSLVACSDQSAEETGAGSFKRHTIEHDGLEREYFVYLPAKYSDVAELPVVFFLHGYGGSGTGTEAETTNGLNIYAEEYGYVMVYPQSTWFMSDVWMGEPWEVSSWNAMSGGLDEGPEGPLCTPDREQYPCPPECGECGHCAWSSCHDDIGFLERLFETIAADFNTDRNRFFVSGFSNGSMMANYVGCTESEWFAGVALVSGRLERGFQCAPTESLALFQINGGRDTTVPVDGSVSRRGYFYASSSAVAEEWNKGTGCEDKPQPWSSGLSEEHGLQCTATCAGSNKESIDCIWPEGEHYWGGYPIGHGSYGYCVTELQQESMPEQTLCVEPNTDVDVWGSRLVFDFFEAH